MRAVVVRTFQRGHSAARLALVAGLAIGLWTSSLPAAQPPAAAPAAEPQAAPDLAASVTRLLSAPYLTDDEKADIRLFHGVWLDSDLDSPARAARAAVARGDYLDPSIDFPEVDPMVRIEALIGRGDFVAAGEALANLPKKDIAPVREFRLRAMVQEQLGQIDAAAATCEAGLSALSMLKPAMPGDVVDGVRMLDQRIRLKGTGALPGDQVDQPAGEAAKLRVNPQAYHEMLQALGEVRANAGAATTGAAAQSPRLFWPSLVAEAEILYSRDNGQLAQAALAEALSLNPTCVPAWALLGRMSVDAFNFDATEKIAQRLDIIAGHPAPGAQVEEGDDELPWVPSASIDAALIRARASIRGVDGAMAAVALDPLIEKYPKHPRLLALRAAADAVKFDFDAVKARLASFDKLYSGSPVALFEVGKALAESRQYAESAAMLAEAHQRIPAMPEMLSELGLMYVQFGKDELALEALEKAHELDPFNLRVDNSLRLVRELLTYDRVESPHFIVKYKPGVDEVFARDILDGMEGNFKLVTGDGPGGVDFKPHGGTGKTVIDLMPDHQWFGVRIAGMPRIHTIAASTGPVIAMEAPREGPNHNGNYDWLRVLRHEYTHTVNLDRTKNRIPHWFTEANAVYLELSPRDWPTCQLLLNVFEADEFFDFDEINISFVRPIRPTDRAQGYAQGHWMYEYIIERWGKKAPLDLMDLYAQGVREEQAYASVLGMSRAEFLREFKAWARSELIKWGMLPAADLPSVKSLLEEYQKAASPAPAPAAPEADPAAADARPPATEAKPIEPDDDGAGKVTPEMIRVWIEKHPAHPDVLDLAVDQAVRDAGGRANAGMEDLLRRYAAARPVDPKPHRLLAQLYLGSADPTEQLKAIEHLEYLDAREQKSTAFASELARRYFARGGEGDLALALAKAERATQLAPYEAPPRELAATIAVKAGKWDTAQRHIEALVKLEPDRAIHAERLEAVKKLRAGG